MVYPLAGKAPRDLYSGMDIIHYLQLHNMDNHTDLGFDLEHTLHEIKHYLPSQMTLKDFIHHNSLHPFQGEKFYEGIFKASKIFGYKVTLQLQDYRKLFAVGRIRESVIERIIIDRKGSEELANWSNKVLLGEYDENIKPRVGLFRCDWKRVYKIDLDTLVHPLLYRILCAYLDQGISIWPFPAGEKGFLESLRELEANSSVSFFRTKKARQLLQDRSLTIEQLLNRIVGNQAYYEQYLFDMAFSHRGWSGMVAILEDNPNALLVKKPISLRDLVQVELLMELDMLDLSFGEHWKPLAETATEAPVDILADTPITELDDVLKIWQDAFEWSYYDDVIKGIKTNVSKKKNLPQSKKFQAIFCIDERECSLRRHFEYVVPSCETFGAPGFFGVEFYYRQQGAKFNDKLCPAPVTPKYLVKEYDADIHREEDITFSPATHGLLKGLPATLAIGFMALLRLFQTMFRPKMSPAISNAFSHMSKSGKLTVENTDPNEKEDGLQVGFTLEEMATRVENFLRGIGLLENFAPLVYVIAHGSSSANNPHHGAHDCGACSGRPGCVNARVFTIMANHDGVRAILRQKGIDIPDTTHFLPAMHDTASDQVGYYDDENLQDMHAALHRDVKQQVEDALDLNAKERSRRFASIDTTQHISRVRKAILDRSVSMFEPRPELGHGTNTLAIIGRRNVTRGLFLDRRAFLNSYDYRTDPDGKYLTNVMAPIGVVCGGINLEYYFSRVDNVKLGCGTKLPHNVMGLIGVANSSDGDLRPGLPWQMIEPHDPLRLLVIVEHYPEVVLKVIQSNPAMYEWYKNEWVHIAALHPESGEFFYFRHGHFLHHQADPLALKAVENVHHLFEQAPEMITNHITHATFENLPIYQIENHIEEWN